MSQCNAFFDSLRSMRQPKGPLMRRLTILIATAALVSACNSRNETEPTPTDVYTGAVLPPTNDLQQTESSEAPGAPTALGSQSFVDSLASANLYEVEAAKIAIDHSKTEEIRAFARQMVDDHEKAQTQLEKAVTTSTAGLKFSPKLDPQQEALLSALRAAGAKFDETYVKQQQTAHEQTLAMLTAFASHGEGEDLRKLARSNTPVVAAHLDHARQLRAG